MLRVKMSVIAVLMVLVLPIAVNANETSKIIRVACVGDSITEAGLVKDNKNYPTQLSELLGDKYLVKNFGRSGATLLKKGDRPYWKDAMYKKAHTFNPDIVIIMLGTNDSKRQNWKHSSEFVADYLDLIKTFQDLTSKPTIFIALPPPAFSGRYGINGKIISEELIPLTKKVATKAKLKTIDLNTLLLSKCKDGKSKQLLFQDGIHPTKAGFTIITKMIANSLKK